MNTVTPFLQTVRVRNDAPEGLTLAEWRLHRQNAVLARRSPRRSFRERILSLPSAPQPRFA